MINVLVNPSSLRCYSKTTTSSQLFLRPKCCVTERKSLFLFRFNKPWLRLPAFHGDFLSVVVEPLSTGAEVVSLPHHREEFFDFSHNAHGFFIKVVKILQVFEIDDLAMKSRLPSLPPAKGFASRPLLLKHKFLADTFFPSDFLTRNSSCSSNYHHC